MRIIAIVHDYVYDGDVIEAAERACRECGERLLEVFPAVAAILVGSAGSYPHILHECGNCERYYWKAGVNERDNSNS